MGSHHVEPHILGSASSEQLALDGIVLKDTLHTWFLLEDTDWYCDSSYVPHLRIKKQCPAPLASELLEACPEEITVGYNEHKEKFVLTVKKLPSKEDAFEWSCGYENHERVCIEYKHSHLCHAIVPLVYWLRDRK